MGFIVGFSALGFLDYSAPVFFFFFVDFWLRIFLGKIFHVRILVEARFCGSGIFLADYFLSIIFLVDFKYDFLSRIFDFGIFF